MTCVLGVLLTLQMCRASLAVAAGRVEVGVLQSQLERLEGQLEKAREASTLDKQACRTAEAELHKVLDICCQEE